MDERRASRGSGDRRGTGEGLEGAAVGEAADIVTDLGEHPRTEYRPEPGDAGHDRRLRMRGEGLVDVGLELGQGGRESVELADQAAQLHAQGLLDRGGLLHVLGSQ